jgi:hypothetical protein
MNSGRFRRKSLRILLFTALVLLLMLSVDSTALACDCLDLSPQKSLEEADVVFEGELKRSTQTADEIAYNFEVEAVIKGDIRNEVTLFQRSSNCSPTFFPDSVYRVYARPRHDGKLFSTVCFANEVIRTRQLGGSDAGFYTSFRWSWPIKTVAIAGMVLVSLLIISFAAKGLRPKRTLAIRT